MKLAKQLKKSEMKTALELIIKIINKREVETDEIYEKGFMMCQECGLKDILGKRVQTIRDIENIIEGLNDHLEENTEDFYE